MKDHRLDTVRAYHERTKHRLDGYARGPEFLDWDNQPNPFRGYEGCEVIELPLMDQDEPILSVNLNLTSVANLLELSLGISAWKQYGPDRWALRCNPSSGNLHPTEGYVIASSIEGLENALYHYAPHDHHLEKRGILSDPISTSPALLIGLSSILWREAWKYGERAFRYVQLDVGHALAALKYAASALNLQLSIVPVDDDSLAELLGLQRQQDFLHADREHPDVLLRVSHTTPAQGFTLPKVTAWSGKANPLGGDPRHDWKILDEISQASWNRQASPETTTANPDPPGFAPLATCIDQSQQTLVSLIRQRRSAQAFIGEASSIQQDEFFTLLNSLMPIQDPDSPMYWAPPAYLHLIIFVHRVEGLEPGLYALPRHSQGLQHMQQSMKDELYWSKPENCPPHLPLYQLWPGDFRKHARSISCHQEIASSSAFSLGMLAEFDKALQQGPQAYRHLFWEAGFLGQQLYLQAEAIGKRGTGIGCYFDDSLHDLLGIEGTQLQDMYHFTIGEPRLDQRIQTLPPYQHLKRFQHSTQNHMASLKAQIAEKYQQREALKKQLDEGNISSSSGLKQLEHLDTELSSLDSRFKKLWDEYTDL